MHRKKNRNFKKPNREVLIHLKAFLFHAIPCRDRKETLWNWGAWCSEPGILLRYPGTAFQPSLLRSSGKHAYVHSRELPQGLEAYVSLSEDEYKSCQRAVAFAGRALSPTWSAHSSLYQSSHCLRLLPLETLPQSRLDCLLAADQGWSN